jgi:hypothetical protein
MKLCNNCGMELDETATVCLRCKSVQIDDIIASAFGGMGFANQSPENVNDLSNMEVADFDVNVPVRKFLLKIAKEEYTEQIEKKVKIFLEAKELSELFSAVVILYGKLNSLHQQYQGAQNEFEADTINFSEFKKIKRKLKMEEETLLDQFDKAIQKSSSNGKDVRHSYLESAFKKINKNINALFGMKDETKGFWIFKSHKYSAKQLFESSEYHRIHVIAEKMADDLSNWKQNNQLDSYTKRVYNVNRDLLVGRVSELEEAIKSREPTWWDKIKQFFSSLWQFISDILPKLVLSLLLKMGNMPGLIGSMGRGLLSANSSINRLLTSRKDIYITSGKKTDDSFETEDDDDDD